MRFVKFITNSKGLTLLEIILSMAIFSIIAVMFLTMFSSGFKGIIRAGNKAVAAYDSQQKMTDKIAVADSLGSSEYTEDTITFNFIDSGNTVSLDVKVLDSPVDFRGSTSIMKSFVLDP